MSPLDKGDDRNYVLEIAKQFAKGHKHTPDSLQTDRELLFRAVREHKDGWRLLRHATPELRADRELLLAAVKGAGREGWKAMLNAPMELREDRDLGVEAVRRNAAALQVLAPHLREDTQLVSEALGAIAKRIQPKERSAELEWRKAQGLHKRRPPKAAESARVNGRGRMQITGTRRHSALDAVASKGGEVLAERLRWDLERGLGQVFTNEDGEHFRVVQLITLRIFNQNGLMLVMMGRYDGMNLNARCMLPGMKIPDGFQPRETLKQYMDTALYSIRRQLEVDADFDLKEEETMSPTFSMQTKYRKATFKATTKPGLSWKKVAKRVQPTRCRSPHFSSNRSLARRFGTGSANYSAPKAPDIYTLRPVDYHQSTFKLRSHTDLFAWIPSWEFEWLQTSQTAKYVLDEWLDDLDVPAHLASLSPDDSRSASPRSPRSRTETCGSPLSATSGRSPLPSFRAASSGGRASPQPPASARASTVAGGRPRPASQMAVR